jgi:hypothetical protein
MEAQRLALLVCSVFISLLVSATNYKRFHSGWLPNCPSPQLQQFSQTAIHFQRRLILDWISLYHSRTFVFRTELWPITFPSCTFSARSAQEHRSSLLSRSAHSENIVFLFRRGAKLPDNSHCLHSYYRTTSGQMVACLGVGYYLKLDVHYCCWNTHVDSISSNIIESSISWI